MHKKGSWQAQKRGKFAACPDNPHNPDNPSSAIKLLVMLAYSPLSRSYRSRHAARSHSGIGKDSVHTES